MTDFSKLGIATLYFTHGFTDKEIYIIKKAVITLEDIQYIINDVNEYTEYLKRDYEKSKSYSNNDILKILSN